MRPSRRAITATASVCVIATVVVVSLVLNQSPTRGWLFIVGFVTVAMSISSVISDPRELLVALVLGAGPVMGLVSDDGVSWLIGPLGALLLVAGELNAWSWELEGAASAMVDGRRRLTSIVQLALLGLLSSVAVGAAAQSSMFSGPVAVVVAALAIAGLAWVTLPQPHPSGGTRS